MRRILTPLRRRLFTVGVGLAATLGSVLAPVPASADVPYLSLKPLAMLCLHEINVVFDDPITHTGQSFTGTLTSTLSGCVPTDPVFTGTVSGNFEHGRIAGTVDLCLGNVLLFRSTGRGTWVFNDANNNLVVQGLFPFTVNVTVIPLTDPANWIRADGEFVSGPLNGYTGFHRPLVPLILLPNGLCGLPGGITALKTQGTADFRTP